MNRLVWGVAFWLCCLGICSWTGVVAAQEMAEPIVSRVSIVPPPPRHEAITAAPAGKSVWVAGSWDRTPDGWEWMAGGWVQPPAGNAVWMPGNWQQQQRGRFVWVDAYWEVAKHGLIVASPLAIPLAFPEKQVAIPRSRTPVVWQSGHWEWRGTWVWEPGVYVESLIPNGTWVFGQWVRMTEGSFRWTPSHWESAGRGARKF